MRIALVSPLPPFRGGIATFSRLLVSHLVPRHDLYAVNFRRLYPQILFPGKRQLDPGSTTSAPAPTDIILDPMNPRTWDLAARRISAFQPDICLFAYWMPFFIPTYWWIIRKLRPCCKTALLCHNVEEHESIVGLRQLKRRFFQAADRLVLLSSVSQQQLRNMSVTTPSEVLFHPLNPVHGQELPAKPAKAKLGIPEEVPLILFFGLVRPYKGLMQLLEAARMLHSQGVPYHLWVAGEFYQGYNEAASYISHWGLEDCVTLEDRFIPDNEVAGYFSAADVVALPYVTATQSGVVPIAYHFNRPVVVTEVGGLPDVVWPGQTGFLVPPGDASQLAEVLARNLPTGFAAMRGHVARLKGRFGWDSFIARLEQFLSS